MNITGEHTAGTTAIGTLAQGGVSAILLTFLSDTISLMIPFLIATTALIIADLFFGIEAAKKRGDRVRVSRGIRLTVNKVIEYVCWIMVSASLAAAFDFRALNFIIMGIVIGNEIISILTNWASLHGKKITGLQGLLIRLIGQKLNTDLEGVKIEDIEPTNKNKGNDTK